MRPRVLIVDDHAGFRGAASALLEAEGFRVVGEAADGYEALAEARRLRPQLVLLDVQLPNRDGFAVAELLASFADPPAVILISGRPVESFGHRLAGAHVLGFISKSDLTGAALTEMLR